MDQKTMTIKCFRCGKQYLLLEMVMDASGKGMSCRACAGLPPKGSSGTRSSQGMPRAGTASSTTLRQPSIREQFARPKSPQKSSGKFACGNCKYRFSSNKPLEQMSCPYCGSRQISTPSENSADALLHDAGSRDYDF